MYRSHTCGELRDSHVGKNVILSGWVQTLRNHGGLAFIDLRDRSGVCQVFISEELVKDLKIRTESVVKIEGEVLKRPQGMENTKIPTGAIEIKAQKLELLSLAEPLPFSLEDSNEGVNENTRLKYRYLDLRRTELRRILEVRHKVMQVTRRFFTDKSFWEIETPYLYKSTPEGARDYLVPSRVHPGNFYALPQSPQTLKQLLMVAGMERYFQIVRCFRDEDLRADRQPEFTQVDLEVSFLTAEEFQNIIEEFVSTLWKEILGVELARPFKRISYKEAVEGYGSDKPDLRYELKLQDLSAELASSGFKVFSSVIANGGKVIALPVKANEVGALPTWSRKDMDNFNSAVTPFGLKGVAWAKVETEGWNSQISKFFSPEEQKKVNEKLGLKAGDYVFFAAEAAPRVYDAMGALRAMLARNLKLVEDGVLSKTWPFVWVTEFPLFEFDAQSNSLAAAHHPFTIPLEEDLEKLKSTDINVLRKIRANAYDLALNGYEVAGGSFRIFNSDVQKSMFRALGLSDEETKEKFGFFVEALQYGTPPHGGMAFGLDRLVMLLAGTNNIRDVMAFPKTASASDLMSECPSKVSPDQMAELSLQTIRKTFNQLSLELINLKYTKILVFVARQTQNSKRLTGFTMIELLMVIMLMAILGAMMLPQFLDFRNEGKTVAGRAIESSMNTGIKIQKANIRLRCGVMGDFEIPLDSFQANDVTAGASPLCTTAQVTNAFERRIVDSETFPINPHNGLTTVGDCVNTTYVGYCYDATQGIAAISTSTSHTNTCTACFQVANGVGTSTLGCSGSGCVQVCNGISGDCTIDCPGGYCNQTCNGISGNCTLTCEGGHCNQLCNGVSGTCSMTCVGGDCTT